MHPGTSDVFLKNESSVVTTQASPAHASHRATYQHRVVIKHETNSRTDPTLTSEARDKSPLLKRLYRNLKGSVIGCGAFTNNQPVENRNCHRLCPLSIRHLREDIVDNNRTFTDIDLSVKSTNSNDNINNTNHEAETKRIKECDSNTSPIHASESDSSSKLQSSFSSNDTCLTNDSCSTDLNEPSQASWFHRGVPREVTLQILSQKPVGSFVVRESTTKPGCYALSLRVPHNVKPYGIAHYLIMKTSKGYKIKGFTKEFKSLEALITHHSVMQECLPCPLSLKRCSSDLDQPECDRDFVYVDREKDYDMFSDFRNMLTELKKLISPEP